MSKWYVFLTMVQMAGREWETPASVCWFKTNNLPKKNK